MEDGSLQIVNFHLPTKVAPIMRAHTVTRLLEHGVKQLTETNGIAIQDAQEFKLELLAWGLQNQLLFEIKISNKNIVSNYFWYQDIPT